MHKEHNVVFCSDRGHTECKDGSSRRSQHSCFACACLFTCTAAYLTLFACGIVRPLSTQGADNAPPTSHRPPSPPPFTPSNYSDDYVTVRLDTCGEDAQSRQCLSIDSSFFHAFIAFRFELVPNVEVENGATFFEPSDKFNNFATIIDASPLGGISISSIPGRRYNTTLPYDNAPPTDDMHGEYLIFIENHVRCDKW
jgi:hypothetical protein